MRTATLHCAVLCCAAQGLAKAAAGERGSLERHQGGYLLQKQLMEAVAADKRLLRLGEDAFRHGSGCWAGAGRAGGGAFGRGMAGEKGVFVVGKSGLCSLGSGQV